LFIRKGDVGLQTRFEKAYQRQSLKSRMEQNISSRILQQTLVCTLGRGSVTKRHSSSLRAYHFESRPGLRYSGSYLAVFTQNKQTIATYHILSE
jgi:hypothetical protein